MLLPWAVAAPNQRLLADLERDDPAFRLWAAEPANKTMVDNLRRMRDELLRINEMFDRAQAEFHESAVEELVRKLGAMHRVVDLLALSEREQFEVLCSIAEVMRLPPEMRLDVFAEVIQRLIPSVRQ